MDYSAEYTVTSEPLYTRANRPADDGLERDNSSDLSHVRGDMKLCADDGLVEMASALRNTLVGHPFADGTRQTLADALCDGLNCNPNDDSAADTYDALQAIAATALRAQSDAEVEREGQEILTIARKIEFCLRPMNGGEPNAAGAWRYALALLGVLERGEHRKDGA